MNKNKEVTSFVEKATDFQKERLELLRTLVFELVPDTKEQYKWSRPVYAVAEKDYCYFQTTKKHIALGFFDVEKMQKYKDVLEGTGKKMTHVKIKDKDDLKLNLYKEMIVLAAQ